MNAIESLEQFVNELTALQRDASNDEEMFFRGHPDSAYMLQPSVFRNTYHAANEHRMYSELIVSNAADFVGDRTTFEFLVRMQHFELPTRLLDLSTNPLIALYFACASPASSSMPDTDGEVLVLYFNREHIHYFDSERVAYLSNLARLSLQEKQELGGPAYAGLNAGAYGQLNAMRRLTSLVQEEKGITNSNITSADLQGPICTIPKLNNVRISAQAGAFLVYGLDEGTQMGPPGVDILRVTVKQDHKAEIRQQLARLNISERTVYPAIERSARHIRDKYGAA